MSEIKENTAIDEQKEWKSESSDWVLILILSLCFGGLGISENPRISEIEKKVARIEGQMSMIGGKRYE